MLQKNKGGAIKPKLTLYYALTWKRIRVRVIDTQSSVGLQLNVLRPQFLKVIE